MSAPSSTAHAGMVLGGRYELISPIAAGGMAQVWQGRDQSLSRPVAIKILHSHLATDQAFITRFRREAMASARLSHPSIVAIYDTLAQQGIEAIVMELVDGRTLRSVLDEVGALPPADVVDIGVQISDALDVAHRAGIVHRDIKPANIMVASDRRIMVTDFGIAKANKDDDLTHTGTLLGTAKYLAPEQVTGEPVDPRADVYALGIVLFEAATGSPPFAADTDAATALARLREEVPRCRQRRGDVPIELDEAIAKAMARYPDHRYDRARSFRVALAAVDLDRITPSPGDLAALPPPVDPTVARAPSGSQPIVVPSANPNPGQPPAMTPHPVPPSGPSPGPSSGPTPPVTTPTGRQGRREAKRAEKNREQQRRQTQKAAKKQARKVGRQRPTRAIIAGLIISALVVSGMLLAAAGGGGGGETIAPAEQLPIVEALPFDPEGTPPHDERNELAPLAIDGDLETIWRTDGYNREGLAGLKSGVGLVLALDDEYELERIEVQVASADWQAEVYVGDGDFGPNGEDFDGDALGGPVATLQGGDRASASLTGATGSHVLLWITETGRFENPEEWGPRPYRFVLREVSLA